ncbi:MAG TPA: helix-turn-helix domain-containing protein [Nitrospira sp.]|nr:helix-turn-helix domain-containing protein [Nitrospira sp.]
MEAAEFTANRILAGLPTTEAQVLVPQFELLELYVGDLVQDTGEPIHFLHFPVDCAITVTSMEDDAHLVEVCLTGNEGCTGSSIVDGTDRSPCMAMVQITGRAARIATPVITEHLASTPYLNAALLQYNGLLMQLAVVSVGCSRFHSAIQRVARWLAAHRYRTGAQRFPFSDRFLAAQTGMDGRTATETVNELERRGVVTRGHNAIAIADTEALQRHACQCLERSYRATEAYLQRLSALSKEYEDSQRRRS